MSTEPNHISCERRSSSSLIRAIAIFCAMLGFVGCKPDLGRACRDLADKGVVRDCSQATVSAVRKQHHIVEQWDFRESKDGPGYGSIVRYDGSFAKESADTAAVSKEVSGFHYENSDKQIQLETRYAIDPADQGRIVIVIDDF